MEIVLSYQQFDIDNICFSSPLDNLIMGKGLHINLFYKFPDFTINEILLETPIMEAPFGIRKYDETDKKNRNKYYLDLSFKGMDENKEINSFYEKIESLDEYILEKSKKYKKIWNINTDKDLNDVYINQIRFNYGNNKYPPTFKIKMSKNKSGEFNTEIYGNNTKKNVCLENILSKGSKVQVVMKCNGIWSINNKFGITWKVKYIKLISEIKDFPIENNDKNDDVYLLCDFEDNETHIDFDMEDYYIYLS